MTTLQTTTMNAGQVRVVDPILSNVALGYSNAAFIGATVCPRVPVQLSGGQVLQFGKEAFQAGNLRRAPGGRMHRMDIGYLGVRFALVQDGIEGKVPAEWLRDASVMPGIDLGTRATNAVMRVITLGLEIEQAELVTDAANFSASHQVTLSGTSKWSDADSTPAADVDTGRETIRGAVGIYPNQLTLGPTVFNALKNHPRIKEQFKYTSADSLTEEMLARYFNLERVVVGRAVQADAGGTMSDVWGNLALLSYSPQSPSGIEEPSFAYTYTMEGHPLVEQPYYDRETRSWLYPVVYERAPVITCAEAGYLIQGAA
jgi:hypothetical protein